MASARILFARALLGPEDELVEHGGLLVVDGRVRRVLRGRAEVARARTAEGCRALDLGDAVLGPGLVNAHAHLELGALAGRAPRDVGFVGWVGAVLRERAALRPEELERAAAEGATRLLAGGTTTVGDIDTTGAAARALARHPLRARVYREVLDAGDAARRAQALAVVARALPRRARRLEGLSPHAPHTVSPELLAAVARLARRRRVPVSVHWAETAEEVEWLRAGAGPFAAVLGPSPRRSGLTLLDVAGLLGPSLSLVHGNRPEPEELERAARAGATLVHCPGTHAFFGRAPFDLAACLRAGLRLALGTDSLASNDGLDLRREMALLRRAHPELDPRRVHELATRGGARALGLEGAVGRLASGAWADLCAWPARGEGADALLDALTSGALAPASVWVAGRRAPASGAATPPRDGAA